jgi:perosamine synthetase
MNKNISIAYPVFNGNEKKYLNECIDTGWISSKGDYIEKFEQKFAELVGSRYALSCSNGTVSLHLALLALGIKPGDEVIMPDLTYIATANAVVYCGATPIFVDIDRDTWNIDAEQIEAAITPKTKAIIVVHLYGNPADMKAIMEIAAQHQLYVIEDAAEAHGAKFDGKMVGNIGDIGSFSFYGNKIITTGEGGMVTMNNDELRDKVKLFKGQGVDPKRNYWHLVVGYNYRMTNIEAAIGLAQLENFDWHFKQRQRINKLYRKYLAENTDLFSMQKDQANSSHAYWMTSVVLNETVKIPRDELILKMADIGIETRPVFYAMHVMPPYQHEAKFPNSSYIAEQGISLPSHAKLSSRDVQYVVDKLVELCR